MKLYVTVEEFLYAKKIENQTERTLREIGRASCRERVCLYV